MLCNHRQHSVLMATAQPRDMEELEGTLLDPDALSKNNDAVVINNADSSETNNSDNNVTHSIDQMPDDNLPIVTKEAQHEIGFDDLSIHSCPTTRALGDRLVRFPLPNKRNKSTRPRNNHDRRTIRSILSLPSFSSEIPVTAAIPSKYFQYTNDLLANDKRETSDDKRSQTANGLKQSPMHKMNRRLNCDVDIAENTPTAHAISVALKAKLGSDIGRINASAEKEKVKAANREAKAKPFHDKTRIEAAKKIARQRSRENFGSTRAIKSFNKTSPVQEVGFSSGFDEYYTEPNLLLDNVKRQTSLFDEYTA